MRCEGGWAAASRLRGGSEAARVWRGRGGGSQWARAERRAGVSGPAVAAGTRDHGVARTLDRVARSLARVPGHLRQTLFRKY